MKQRGIYGLIVAGGVVGLIASFLQTIEKLNLIQNKDSLGVCNISDIFSCSTVLNSWQSSVFGFPNSLLCIVLFTVFAGVALTGLTGSAVAKGLRLTMQGLALFMLGFGIWSLWQSTFVIGALCIFCLFCFAGLLMANWGWLRLNVQDLPIGKRGREFAEGAVRSGWDTLFWIAFAVVVFAVMIVRFY